jgi:1-acyl-sn-glycerol-3-phosphate acyltransferase
VRSHADHRETGAGGGAHESVPGAHVRSDAAPRHDPPSGASVALPFDERVIQFIQKWIRPFREKYFRAEIAGLGHVPDEPSMLVGNHDGGYIPADAICFGSFYYDAFGFAGRRLYVMMHDFPFRIAPSMTSWLQKSGMLPASRRNAERVFASGNHLVVFPGGAYEAFRTFKNRRQLSLGHRSGFVRQALTHRVPVTPFVSVGGHETLFVLARGHELAKKLGLPKVVRADVLPLWLGLPFGVGWGMLPNLPLPSKIKIEVLEPIRLWKELGEAANFNDPKVLQAGLELVRTRMQAASDRLYAERKYPLFG